MRCPERSACAQARWGAAPQTSSLYACKVARMCWYFVHMRTTGTRVWLMVEQMLVYGSCC